MGQEAATPSIAPISAPVVESAAGAVATPEQIGDMLSPIAARAAAPLPDPYQKGVDIAQPHQQVKPTYQQQDTERRPIANTVYDLKHARRQNAVATMSNGIAKAGEVIEAKKQDMLKDKITSVMKSKTNVENAQIILNDPNANAQQKAMAKSVLEANKKNMEAIMTDPKSQKQLAKAFDVSYVDPSKNKTPEIATMQAAKKEVDSAGIFASNNPQEHQVAEMAQRFTTQKSLDQQLPGVQQQSQQPSAKAAEAPKSATPYADKLLAKDMPTIEANPAYAAAAKQQQDAQKQLATIIPKFIEAEGRAALQAAKDGSAASREVFKASTDYQRDAMKALAQAAIQGDKDKAAMARVLAENRGKLQAVEAHFAGLDKLMARKDLTDAQKANAKTQSLDDLNKQIKGVTDIIDNDDKAIESLQKQYQVSGGKASARSQEEYESALASANLRKQMDLDMQTKLQTIRGNRFGNSWNEQSALPDLKNTSIGNKNSGENNGNSGSAKSADIEQVGSDESDESDNSDSYGTP